MLDKKVDFTVVVNCMFKDKKSYRELSDDDKIKAFFKINQKFACAQPKYANFLNSKYIDKDSAVDIWNDKYKTEYYIPTWYWTSVEKKTVSKNFTTREVEIFKKYNEHLNQKDLEFIFKYFTDDVKEEIRILSKFED